MVLLLSALGCCRYRVDVHAQGAPHIFVLHHIRRNALHYLLTNGVETGASPVSVRLLCALNVAQQGARLPCIADRAHQLRATISNAVEEMYTAFNDPLLNVLQGSG